MDRETWQATTHGVTKSQMIATRTFTFIETDLFFSFFLIVKVKKIEKILRGRNKVLCFSSKKVMDNSAYESVSK